MSALLCDFGNTRAKWRILAEEQESAVEAADYEAFDNSLPSIAEELSSLGVTRCVAASVKGAEFEDQFTEWADSALGLSVEWVAVHHRETLRLAYDDVSQLGIDRFLNMLGAQSLGYESCLVVSAGTAVTFDAVVGSEHKGGAIFPGLGMLSRVLANNTSRIDDHADVALDELFGRSTKKAVSAGVVNGFDGAVAYIVNSMLQKMPEDTRVVLTGGDAHRVSSALDRPSLLEPALVFKGLFRLL